MRKARKTITLDERVLRAVRAKAAKTGRSNSQVIEEALRRQLTRDVFEGVSAGADLDEDEAMRLAVEAQHEGRRTPRS